MSQLPHLPLLRTCPAPLGNDYDDDSLDYQDDDIDDFDVEGATCPTCGSKETIGWTNEYLTRWECGNCDTLWDTPRSEVTA
jgi:ribosomal protein S27AE